MAPAANEFHSYRAARLHAEEQTHTLGVAHGIEKPTSLQGWTVKMLPRPEHRSGWELRCEVVEPESSR